MASPPAPGVGASWLKGQTHVHTDRSHDANTPPERVLEFYQSRHYDFVALTDHNRITVAPTPGNLMLIPGVELTQNSVSCQPKPPPGYRCLIHTTALFVDPSKDAARGERIRFPFVDDRRRAYEAQLKMAADWGGLSVLNHPQFHFAADARLIERLAAAELRFVELANGGLDPQHPRGRGAAEDRAEALWDQVLSQGARVYALATDDAHHFDDVADRKKLGKFAYTGDRAWIWVRARKDPSDIRRALLAGDFYASTGVRLSELSAQPDEIRVVVDEPRSCTIRFTGLEGRELATAPCPRGTFRPSEAKGYVRATVVAEDGSKAWLQPMFVP